MVTCEEVEKVVHVVYQGGAAEKGRREALAWLQNFSTTPEAWAIWLELVGSPTNQTQFFAANMLYAKVQKEWYDQPDATKQDIHQRILQVVREYVRDDSQRLWNKSLCRLCLALARMTVQTPSILEAYMNEVWNLLRGGLEQAASNYSPSADRALFVATELLIDLPEEKEAEESPESAVISDTNPGGIGKLMNAMLGQVVEAVTQLMMKVDKASVHARALECLHAWAPLGVDVPTLARCNLLRPMLMALNTCQELTVLDMASQALIACVKKNSLEEELGQPETPETLASLDQLVEGVLATQSRLAATCDASGSNNGISGEKLPLERDPSTQEDVALSLCKLTVAVAESQIDRIIPGSTPQLLGLVDMVMSLTAHPSHSVSILTLNFWLLIQDYEMARRHESLRETCYFKLLEVLLCQSKLNEDASSGYEEDIFDEIQSFRNSGDGVKDVFYITMYVLGPQYVECMLSVLRNTQDWRDFEAAMFALSSAARVINEQAVRPDPRSANLRGIVEVVLQELSTWNLLGANGATLRSGVQMIGNFASFLARMDLALIERNLNYVIFALPFSDPVSKTAAEAFGRVCIASRLELALHPDAVKTLAAGIEKAYQSFPTDPTKQEDQSFAATKSSSFPVDARLKAVEGIARVASCMKLDACQETLVVLLNPSLDRLTKAVDGVDCNIAAQELRVLCCAVKFLDVNTKTLASPMDHPVAAILAQIMPILEKITAIPALQHDTEVVEALYSLISASFFSAKTVLAQHLESLLTAAVKQFRITWSPCCITCVGKAVEVFVPSQPGSESGFQHLFGRLTENMVECIRDGHAVNDPVIISTFFDTALTFLIFCPGAIFSSAPTSSEDNVPSESTLDAFLQIMAKCVSSDEVESLRSVAIFITSLMSRLGGDATTAAAAMGNMEAACKARDLSQYRPFFDQALSRNGRYLVGEIILALASTCPPTPLAKLAQGLADLTVRYPQLVQESVYATFMQNPPIFARLSDADKECLVTTIPYMAQGVGTKGKEAFEEFARLCRKQTKSETYQKLLNDLRIAPEVIEIA